MHNDVYQSKEHLPSEKKIYSGEWWLALAIHPFAVSHVVVNQTQGVVVTLWVWKIKGKNNVL